ncbi:hypothetical protein AXF42_Ash015266 [Apostasia shenzhenica]|uniref:Uncharacterized protein n=1 Tax=Apostasia shenzhenica TaxID=1088818 RepID=A0A2I0ALR0_9ASPA|nr:hypothetical protein AXF42_Ash015266 [Apostasia shenzhenica]
MGLWALYQHISCNFRPSVTHLKVVVREGNIRDHKINFAESEKEYILKKMIKRSALMLLLLLLGVLMLSSGLTTATKFMETAETMADQPEIKPNAGAGGHHHEPWECFTNNPPASSTKAQVISGKKLG